MLERTPLNENGSTQLFGYSVWFQIRCSVNLKQVSSWDFIYRLRLPQGNTVGDEKNPSFAKDLLEVPNFWSDTVEAEISAQNSQWSIFLRTGQFPINCRSLLT